MTSDFPRHCGCALATPGALEHQPHTKLSQSVWTFEITGGSDFQVYFRNNPPVEHNGVRTLWKMVGSWLDTLVVRTLFESHGAKVEVTTETQNQQQARIRGGFEAP